MLLRVGDIDRFARDAQPGERVAYGRGSHPPRDLVLAMRDLVEAGVLRPTSKREGGEFLFLVERGSARLPRASERRCSRGAARRKQVKRSSLSMVLQCIVAAAVMDRPCPTNDEIARRCGLSGKDSARYRVGLLIKKGRIAIEDRGPLERRVATVLTGRHAGKSTAETKGEG